MKDKTQEQEQTELEQIEQAEQVAPDVIYQNNIYALVDDVKQLPQFANKSDEELKNTKSFFPSLIDYIYNNYIGELLGNKHGKQIAYRNIEQIDNLFYIYCDLVSKYKWNDKPFLIEFSTFTGINNNTFYNWLKGNDNIDSATSESILTPERSETVQKWVNICERALLNGSSADQIRDIFLLKAKHGYREADKDYTVTVQHRQVISADDLTVSLPDFRKN